MKELQYEKILFGFNPCYGLWGLIDDKFAYDYVNEELFRDLLRYYETSLWGRKPNTLSELSSIEILKFERFFSLKDISIIFEPIKTFSSDKKYDLILGLTQLFNDEFENSVQLLRRRNLYYLSLHLGHNLEDYKGLTEYEVNTLNKDGLVLYGTLDDCIHATNNYVQLKDILWLSSKKQDLYEKAVNLIKQNKKASIPFLQQKLDIDYLKASQIIQELENNNIISTLNPNGTRKILV